MRSDKYAKRANRNKWILRGLAIFLIFLAFVFGSGVGYYGSRIATFLDDVSSDTPEELQDTTEQDQNLADLRPFSILILGIDAEDGVSRSDTIMVATINPEEESVKLVSIPRDTMIDMPLTYTHSQEKINAMYALGGVPMVLDTVEEYLDIPISFYATLDFEGLVSLVDAVGGIDVVSERAFTVQDSEENMDAIQIEEGPQHLDGEHALGYARMRKQDPRGDWGRQERQREVIESLVDELISLNTLTNFNAILDAIRPNLQTNLNGQQMWTIANNYSSAARSIESLTLTGEADYVYFPHYGQDVYVWVPFEESLEEVQQELRGHLELESTFSNDGVLEDDFEEDDIAS